MVQYSQEDEVDICSKSRNIWIDIVHLEKGKFFVPPLNNTQT